MTIGKNFCIAPFTQITLHPAGGYSPCPEIGGRPWKEKEANAIRMWKSDEFNTLRTSFKNNQKDSVCNRCWQQEEHGNQSLRQRLFTKKNQGSISFQSGEILPFIDKDYQSGPKQINIMVGNTCNLRCRICTAGSSVTYNVEGNYYKDRYGVDNPRYRSLFKKPISFSSSKIEYIFEISSNLQRIEFYGGEPLLDEPTLDLLQQLITSGRSKNITLFYNTNGTVKPTAKHYELWNQFRSLEFNFSIDDIDHRFTYARHPANWEDLISNINLIRNYKWNIPVQFTSICTVSILNIYYVPEILERLDNLGLPSFLNNINGPDYYDIQYLPWTIKQAVIEKLKQFSDVNRIKFLINTLNNPEDLKHWEDFKFWTRAKDEYRKENFAQTYPEFYHIINRYDSAF